MPFFIYDSARIGAGATASITFAGGTEPGAKQLIQFVEKQLCDVLLDVFPARLFLLEALGWRASRDVWWLIDTKREVVLPESPTGRPGDFDIIVGPVHDGVVSFDELAEIEVKIRKVSRDGSPRSAPSGQGTTQAKGAAELGFDRVLLLHILVSEDRGLPPGYAPSWRAICNAQADRAMTAAMRKIQQTEADITAPYGYAIASWGPAPAASPANTGAVFCPIVREAPLRPLHHRPEMAKNQSALRRGLEHLLGERRPATERFLRHCERCHRLLSAQSSCIRRCRSCS